MVPGSFCSKQANKGSVLGEVYVVDVEVHGAM